MSTNMITRRVLFAVGLTIAVAMTGCNKPAASAEDKTGPAAMPIKTAVVQRRDMSRTIDLTGEVVPGTSVVISAMVEGPISQCPWREGDRVDAGETLVVIDRDVYGAEVDMAKAALAVADARLADLKAGARPEEIAQAAELVRKLTESASFGRLDLDRTTALVAKQGLPGEMMEKAKVSLVDQESQLESAKQRLAMLKAGPTPTQVAVAQATVQEAAARLKLADARLRECTVLAPFEGVVRSVHVRPGDIAMAKSPLLEMYDLKSLVVRFAVPEAQAGALRERMSLTFNFDALPGQSVPGKLLRVYPDLDRRLRTRTVEAVPDTPVPLAPGMFSRVRLTLQTAPAATAVPAEAILGVEGQQAAFIVSDGKVTRRPVKVGMAADGFVQILEGIAPGDMVALGALGKLKDGMAVSAAAPATSPQPKSATAPVEAPR